MRASTDSGVFQLVPGTWLHLSAGRTRNHFPSPCLNLNQRAIAKNALPVDSIATERFAKNTWDRALSIFLDKIYTAGAANFPRENITGGVGRRGMFKERRYQK